MKYVLFIFLMSILYSCTENKQTDPFKSFETIETLKGEKYLDLEEFGVLKPRNLIYWDKKFIVRNTNHKNLLSIIDIQSSKVVHAFQKGEGPGEIVSVGSIECQSGQIYLYDIARKILYQMDIESGLTDTIPSYNEYTRLQTIDRPFLVNKTDKGLIATGLFEENVFMYIRSGSENSEFFVDYPEFEITEDMTHMENATLFLGARVSVKPDQNKLACFFPEVGAAFLCDIKADKIEKYKQLIYHAPKVKNPRTESLPVIVYEGDNKVAFCDIISTNEHIYVLYSGRSFNSHKEKAYECEHLFVYDWNGNPVKRFHLDIPLCSFCLDSVNNIIYGVAMQPEGIIVKYRI